MCEPLSFLEIDIIPSEWFAFNHKRDHPRIDNT